MLTTEQIDRLLSQGANVLSGDGEKIGSLSQVFVDNDEGQPRWATVKTGLFGMSESFVPLDGARTEGNNVVVPYSKDQVKDAPRIDADRPMEPAEEERLYQHYQLDRGRTSTEASAASADFPGTDGVGARETTAPTVGAGYDDATPTGNAGAGTDRVSAGQTTPPVATARSGGPGYDTTTTQREDTLPSSSTGYDTTTPPATGDAEIPAAPSGYDTSTAQRETAEPTGSPGYGTKAPVQRDDVGTDRTTPGEATAPPVATAPTGSAGYDTTAPPATAGATPRDDTGTDRAGARDTTAPPTGDAGYDGTVPTTGDATARPEKQPDVGAEQPSTGRGRLRKYVTTETVSGTVPVQREEVRIEREPITAENRDEVLNRADKDDQGDVILHEERIIVTKETVPVERIHIGTETVTDEVPINEEVRKEHVDTEGQEGTEESRR